MRDHAEEALSLVTRIERSRFDSDRVLQLALTRLIEVVGEAASRVSEETRTINPSIPWKQIVGMRNRLIHGYDMLDLDLLWITVTEELPQPVGELDKIVGN